MSERETAERIEVLLDDMRVKEVTITVDRRYYEDLVIHLGAQGMSRWVVWLLKWSKDPENRTAFDPDQEPGV